MYGYSHGGCITYRAVEQGAPINAFSVIEGFTDLRLTYLTGRSASGLSAHDAALGSGAFVPPAGPPATTVTYQPDASGVMGYNWRSAHYFAARGDLSIQKFKTMPILILQGDVDLGNPPGPKTNNPVFLNQATEIAADIGAANIFVGPTGVSPPTSEPCIAGAVGAALPASLTAPNATCAVSFTPMNTGDPCMSALPLFSTPCQAVSLPTPPSGGMPHYLVVFHGMGHINGALAIQNTLSGFAEHSFSRKPGCNGLLPVCDID